MIPGIVVHRYRVFILSIAYLITGLNEGNLGWAAHTESHTHHELESIKERLTTLEQDSERRRILSQEDKRGEEAFPLQTQRKTRLSGGLTLIAQGVGNNADKRGGDHAEGSLSLDLILESEIREGGFLIVRGDFMRGAGLSRLPPLFIGGVNADIEDFSTGDTGAFHLIEAFYEQNWQGERFRMAAGQIDLTSYFDQNRFANSETFQFLSPPFVNNAAINWGGDANGYGAGVVLHGHPAQVIKVSAGFFEGDGDYTDLFDHPFWIVEVEYEVHTGDLAGHYRLSYWSNETAHPKLLNPGAMSNNEGIGFSFDQALSEGLGIWGRFGIQDESVSEFDRHASIGLALKGIFGRTADVIGVAVAATWIGGDHQQVSGLSDDEYAAEAYYKLAVGHGLYLTPDFQYIAHPGGDGAVDPIAVYGLRGQLDF